MVRTECRKCRWGSVDRGACEIPYQHPMQLAVWLWTQNAKPAWEDGMVYYYWNKCPGCVKRESVVAQSNNGQTNSMATAPATQATDTISVEPRKRSDEGNSQGTLDGSEPDGCQCAAGPWREDVGNAPEGVPLLVWLFMAPVPIVAHVTKTGWFTLPVGGGKPACIGMAAICRFAVIGGK